MSRILLLLFLALAVTCGADEAQPPVVTQEELQAQEEAALERIHLARDARLRSTLTKEQMEVFTRFCTTRDTELKAQLAENVYRGLKRNTDIYDVKIDRLPPVNHKFAEGESKQMPVDGDRSYLREDFGSYFALATCKNDVWRIKFGGEGLSGPLSVYIDASTGNVLYIHAILRE